MQKRGVSLVALIITIIVLIILTASVVMLAGGENGIIGRAQRAVEANNLKVATEKVLLEVEDIRIKMAGTDQTVAQYLYDTTNGEERRNELKEKGISIPATLPVGEELVFTVGEYLVTTDLKGNILSTNKNVNQPHESNVNVATPGIIVTGSNATYTKNGTAIIPVGFAIVPGLDDVSQGLVISDVANDTTDQGNQFVWIPVDKDNFETNFKLLPGYSNGELENEEIIDAVNEADATGINPDVDENDIIKNETIEMYSSVQENGGFYIGRYETGIEDGAHVLGMEYWDNDTGKAVSKKNAYVWNYIGWSDSTDMKNINGGAVEKARTFSTNNNYSNVNSTLCYGVQWDAIMSFIDPNYLTSNCNPDSFVRNSEGKGNYGEYDEQLRTGVNDNYAVKNIYDLAGNVREWTMETVYGENRSARGGSVDDLYNNGYPASCRCGNEGVNLEYYDLGFRIALYLAD